MASSCGDFLMKRREFRFPEKGHILGEATRLSLPRASWPHPPPQLRYRPRQLRPQAREIVVHAEIHLTVGSELHARFGREHEVALPVRDGVRAADLGEHVVRQRLLSRHDHRLALHDGEHAARLDPAECGEARAHRRVVRQSLARELQHADAEAFEPRSKAYGIPKEDPTRDQVLEEATVNALEAPMEMMRQIAKAIELLEELKVKGSKMLISDVACGAALSAAAMQAAALNVFINTKSLLDRDLAAKLEAEADELLAYVPRAKAVADEITAYIRG